MPTALTDDQYTINYLLDDFTDPWKRSETAFLAPGLSGSSSSVYAFVPGLAREYRVVRIDPRGSGQSTKTPPGYRWTLDQFATDTKVVLDHLDVEKVHYIGSSFGGVVGQLFAARFPERLKSLVLCTSPYYFPQAIASWADMIDRIGAEAFFRQDLAKLYGPDADSGMVEWAVQQRMRSNIDRLKELYRFAATINLGDILPKISVPTLIIAAELSDRALLNDAKFMHEQIRHSEMVIFEKQYHGVANVMPEKCLEVILKFLEKV